MFKIDSNLFTFPFDKQVVGLKFAPNNFANKPFYIEPTAHFALSKEDFGVWKVTDIFPSYSTVYINTRISHDEVNNTSPNIVSFPVVSIKILIERHKGWLTVTKFILPTLLIFVLALSAFFFLKSQHLDSKVDILINCLLGFISVYFIFSLLANIEELIVMDYVYFFFILSGVVMIVLTVLKIRRECKNNC